MTYLLHSTAPVYRRSWKDAHDAGCSFGGGGEAASGSGTGDSGGGEGGGDGDDGAAKKTEKEEEGESAQSGADFTPSPEQVQMARHLGHRLELARIVAAGVREKTADLRQQLDAQAREVSRSREDLALAKRQGLSFTRIFFTSTQCSST